MDWIEKLSEEIGGDKQPPENARCVKDLKGVSLNVAKGILDKKVEAGELECGRFKVGYKWTTYYWPKEG